MFHHIVWLCWQAVAVQAEPDVYQQLAVRIPDIRNDPFGPDVNRYTPNADYVLATNFDNEGVFRRYVAHPAHAALMEIVFMPIRASYNSVQLQC